MAQQIKSTHQGNCQICGRLQAVQAPKGLLAKHGYTVKGWGFFNGTCQGSDRLPLQQERRLTDSTCATVTAHAEDMDTLAEQYRAGDLLPEQAKTGNRVLDQKKGYYIDEMGPFATASKSAQDEAVERAGWMVQEEARNARGYVKHMQKLAGERNGTPMIAILKTERVAPVAPTVDVKAGTVSGVYATKAARQADLDRLSRQYEKAHKALQAMYLALPNAERTKERTELYYGPQFAHWRPKHSAAALKHFPGSEQLVQEIEALVKAREAVKNA